MGKEKEEGFSSRSPEDLIQALRTVGALLDGGADQDFSWKMRLAGGGESYHQALNVVQDSAGIKEDWVREARVKWLELGLKAWEEWLSGEIPREQLDFGSINSAGFAAIAPRGMTFKAFKFFITPAYTGAACNRLMDRLFEAMIRLIHQAGLPMDKSVSCEMRHLIERRTNCLRPDDPHRDETTRRLLMKYYGL